MSGEINTLIHLLAKYEVRIPIIQRDYAQGRNNEKSNEVRKNLINDIKSCFDDGGKSIDFNFVYGTVADDIFYPVDGQQRLTTLYLLHWFLACNCDKFDCFATLKGFTYMTRNSASEFFALLKNPNNKLRKLVKESKKLRKDIKNESWFQVEWGYDPTVDGALTFLNELSGSEEFRNNAKQYYERLENNAIYFTHILENGDEAETKAAKSYIRMNSRGKSLEAFENVKAMIDSIDSKLHTPLGFTNKYDSKYIDILYSNCTGSTLEKTAKINKRSLNCLKNVYNLNCQLKGKDTLGDEAKFISEIYWHSQKRLSNEESEFFCDYFCMIIAVFDYFSSEPNDDEIKNIFEPKGNFCENDNKFIIAIVLYIYYFHINKGSVMLKVQLEKYIYVLHNLNLTEWSECFLKSINNFANAVAKNEDIFDYFIHTDLPDVQKTCHGVLEDINVRMNEQKIKADIIKRKGLSWDYFNELEIQSVVRKIQYLFYLSGYLDGVGDYKKLLSYIDIAKIYLKSYSNDLEWRKIFAMTVHLDCNCTLMAMDDINKNSGSNHIWEDEFLFWNDEEDKNLSVTKPQLKQIKIAYENKAAIDYLIRSLLSDSNYDNCWLKYAIKYNYIELLDKKLIWDSSTGIVKLRDDANYRYDIYIMHVVNKQEYGLKKLIETAESNYEFDSNIDYIHSYEEIKLHVGGRKFVMRLNIPVSITNINEKYDKSKCLYSYDGANDIYTIYKVNSPYEFTKANYNITSEVQKQKYEYNKQLLILKSYNEDNYLEIKDRKKQEWQQEGRRAIWKIKAIPIAFSGGPSSTQFKL